jgi:predicted enzyme related to lactoylglutathione lyase
MARSQSGFIWYELLTHDVAAAKTFYGHVVGWTMGSMPGPNSNYTILQAAGTGVGGMMPMPPHLVDAKVPDHWVGYVYADNVDDAVAKIKSLGGSVHLAPTDIPDVGRFAVCADPQGALFQLLKPNQPGERVPSDEPGHITWHELHTTNWEKAFDFYATMFGWEKGRAMDMGPMGTYQLFTLKGADAGAMFNSPVATQRSFWLYYFNVDEIEAARKRIIDGGGKVMHGPSLVPDGSWIVQATDPKGAWFAVRGPKK